MFRFTLLRRMTAVLCMALLMGGIVSVGELVGDDGRVPHEFAFHAEVYAQECDGGGGDQGNRPECERGRGGGGGGGGGGCGLYCKIKEVLSVIGGILNIACRFTDKC